MLQVQAAVKELAQGNLALHQDEKKEYRELYSLPSLRSVAGQDSWRTYLIENSGLPGPPGNLELDQAVVAEGDEALFLNYLEIINPQAASVNTPGEFLAFYGALGLGRLVAERKLEYLEMLRYCASGDYWRNAVTIALQNRADSPFSNVHNQNISAILHEAEHWSHGNYYEQRAAMAAVCEPRLLTDLANAERVITLLNNITSAAASASDQRDESFQTIRKALGYGWRVAVAAYPTEGKLIIQSWITNKDKGVRWVMKENLKKNRLLRIDEAWIVRSAAKLEQ